jgi:hypothetical protein
MKNAVPRFRSSSILFAAALAIGACTEDKISAPGHDLTPQLNSTEAVAIRLIKLGPTGTTATFSIAANGGSLPLGNTVTLNACTPDGVIICTGTVVWVPTNSNVVTVTITETGTSGGTVFDQIAASSGLDGSIGVFAPDAPTVTVHVNDVNGALIRFKNVPGQNNFLPGRMTGGGGQLIIDDVRVTRGFTIHCDIVLSNNIEINWGGNKWHIDKPITSALCIDDPAIDPAPPEAPFDTFLGEAIGRYNGVAGYTLRFKFVDSGEPGGSNDMASILILAPNGDVVLNVPFGYLDHGNLQAHYDQPHK